MITLKHPYTMLVAGPTGSGKTTWLKELIKHTTKNVYYFYGQDQAMYKTFKKVKLIHGLQLDLINGIKDALVIIDDLMTDAASNNAISDLFTKGSHHRNLSIILVVQNLFNKGKEMRNISLNSHYIVLFKNPRDRSIACNIARQMYPSKCKVFQQVYDDATENPYSYLFIDLKPDTPEEMRLLTDVFGKNTHAYII